MVILAFMLLALGGILIWSGMTGRSGFREVRNLLTGSPAFVKDISQ